MIAQPQLSILAFAAADDTKTQQLLNAINNSREFFLTSCRLEGRLVIRVCLLGFRTHYQQIENLVKLVQLKAASL